MFTVWFKCVPMEGLIPLIVWIQTIERLKGELRDLVWGLSCSHKFIKLPAVRAEDLVWPTFCAPSGRGNKGMGYCERIGHSLKKLPPVPVQKQKVIFPHIKREFVLLECEMVKERERKRKFPPQPSHQLNTIRATSII